MVESGQSYVVRDWIAIGIDEARKAADVGMRTGSTASHTSGLVEMFKESTIKTF